MSASEVAVIGAGVAGLTAAALLAKAGARVTVFEHHNLPGGCASFYQREGFRFDVGATVVNGFGENGIHRRVFEHLGISMHADRVDPAMCVHVGPETIVRYGDERWAAERRRAFGAQFEPFWRRQESIADRVWSLSRALPVLPVDAPSIAHLARIARAKYLPLLALQGRTLSTILPDDASPLLRAFVDLQLLITAQSTAREADLTFGAAALDIAREGTYHLEGGIGDIAVALARSVRRSGGSIRYLTDVASIEVSSGRARGVRLASGERIATRTVIAAVPYENVLRMLGRAVPGSLRTRQRWGAVTAYAGVAPGIIEDDAVLHHQLLYDPALPLGEGNSAFVSISGAGDRVRARNGGRAITISTHTDPARWERARDDGTLETLRNTYRHAMMRALERVSGKRIEPLVFDLGTPLTFERYTARYRGFVGGTPQTPDCASLHARSHRTGIRGLLLCRDTAFPGQSTVGVTLSAINAVRALGVTM
jgi:C-3',4' desaturase CrtD